VNKN